MPSPSGTVDKTDVLEWAKDLGVVILAAVITWVSSYFIPQLQEEGGTVITLVIIPLLTAAVQFGRKWLNNTDEVDPLIYSKLKVKK